MIFPKFYQILKQYFLVHSFIHDDQNMLQGIRRWKGTTFTESNCEGEIERDADEKRGTYITKTWERAIRAYIYLEQCVFIVHMWLWEENQEKSVRDTLEFHSFFSRSLIAWQGKVRNWLRSKWSITLKF